LEYYPFSALLFLTVLAVAVPVLVCRFQRMRLPIVDEELFAGVIIGCNDINVLYSSSMANRETASA